MVYYEPDTRDRDLLPHDPFKAFIAPRPVGWVSTVGPGGEVNLAPYNGRFDTAGVQPIARCGYRGDYAVVSELFELLRPA
jgi:hypothetical protein